MFQVAAAWHSHLPCATSGGGHIPALLTLPRLPVPCQGKQSPAKTCPLGIPGMTSADDMIDSLSHPCQVHCPGSSMHPVSRMEVRRSFFSPSPACSAHKQLTMDSTDLTTYLAGAVPGKGRGEGTAAPCQGKHNCKNIC